MTIGYTVLISNYTVAVDQDESVFTFAALGILVLKAIRTNEDTESRVNEHISVVAFGTSLTIVC